MDNPHTRDKVSGPDLHLKASVREEEDGLAVTISAEGVSRVPLGLELAFSENVRIENESLTVNGTDRGGILLRKGNFLASLGEQSIEIGPSFGAHDLIAPEEGRTAHSYTIFFTDFTEFSHTIHIRAVPSLY